MLKKKELRKKLIESKLSDIMESITIIGENLPREFKDFAVSGLIKEGIYKKIEFAIESIIDICSIINSDLRLGMPEEDEDILNNLEKKNIFSTKILSLIKDMKRFRNILVHKYGKIDDKKAYENIKEGLQDFEKIINEIEEFLNKKLKS